MRPTDKIVTRRSDRKRGADGESPFALQPARRDRESWKEWAIRHGLHIAVPAFLMLAVSGATVTLSLDRMAGVVNGIEDRLTARSTEAAMHMVLKRIGQSHRDYAEWDDAVRRLYGGIDPTFVSENFESATATQAFFDTVLVLDEDREVVVAIRAGKNMEMQVGEAFGRGLDELMSGLSPGGHIYEVRTGFVRTAWGVAAMAVGPIVPSSAAFPRPAGPNRYLVTAKDLDDTAIGNIAGEYLIDGLHFVRPGESVSNAFEIVDPNGDVLAALSWTPGKLGSQAHADVRPIVAIMLALIGATVAILISIAVRGLNRIKTNEDRARHSASHDALTGLANRPALLRAIDDALGAFHGDAVPVGLIYLDLDGFKEVNDAYGHDIGDRLLRNIAAGFRTICGDRLVARVGGDEFAILLRGKNAVDGANDTCRLLIRYLAQPFDIDGRIVVVGTSIGTALVDRTVTMPEEALRRADVAMYVAKQQGRNRVAVYDASVDIARHERLGIATELGADLRAGRLEILYQAQFSAATREIVGAEALLRWPRQKGEQLPASVFVPIAEETGLIDDLGAWVLRQACRDAGAWPGIRLAVNVSPAQLRNPNFEHLVHRIIADSGLQHDRLELEVTENYLVSNPVQARESIDAIRALGVSIALDDFGTGYSSVGYLRSFTFDKLKLDRSLTTGLGNDPRAQRFVQATIALADSLDLSVIAEGVESEEEAILLRAAGCREFQGFYFAAPCSAAEFARMLDRQSDRSKALSA